MPTVPTRTLAQICADDRITLREDETTVHEVEVQDAIDWCTARPPGIESSRSMKNAYLLAAEVVGLRADIKRLETANDVIVATNEKLAKELHHWKNNHETEVRRARMLKERTDMPVERVRAYDQWGKDQQTIADLRQRIIELEGKVV